MANSDYDKGGFKASAQPIARGQEQPAPALLLHNTCTNGTLTISPEMFSKIYLTPPNRVKGHLRETFGNPSPLTLLGLCMSLTPISCDLMGWGGSGGNGAATIGTYFFVGGLLMVVAGVLEFLLGNTFPFVVSCGFGGFWLTMGASNTPGFGVYAAYSPDQNNPMLGLSTPGFLASFAFFFVCMAIFSFISLICTLRTNVVQVIIFLFLTIQYSILASSYWTQADGMVGRAHVIAIAGGAAGFIVITAGWYLFAAQMLAAVDFPIALPVGDLSTVIPGASSKRIIEGKEQNLMV